MRFGVLAFVALAAFALVPDPAVAQVAPTDLTNDTGVKPWEYYDGAKENVNLGGGNLNIVLPLLGLPGRGGQNLNLSLAYNSQHWSPVGTLTTGNNPQLGIDWQSEQSNVPATGWQLNIPMLFATGVTTPPVNNQEIGCWQNFVLVMGDGARYSFSAAKVSCFQNFYQGSTGWVESPLPQSDSPISIDDQNSGVLLDAWRGVVTFKDGSQIWFPTAHWLWANAFPSGTQSLEAVAYVDTNGNVISLSTSSSGVLTVTDTAERQVSISNGITTLQYYNSAGTIETITVNYAPFSGAPTPVFSEPVSGSGNDGVSVSPITGEISSIVLPNGLTYTFQYDSYGEITKITYSSGGYTRYTYEALERPYEWPGNFGGTADQREVTGKYVCRAAVTPAGATSPSGYTGVTAPNTCTAAEDFTSYAPVMMTNGSVNASNAMVDPLGNKAVYTYTTPSTYLTQTYQGSSTLLKAVTDTQTQNHLVERVITLPNGLTSTTKWTYDMTAHTETESATDRGVAVSWSMPITSYNVTEVQEYGFDSNLARQTTYANMQVNPYNHVDYYGLNLHILDRKLSEIIYDGSSNRVAETDYTIDQYSVGISLSYATQHGYPIAAQWFGLPANSNSYSPSYTTRGNLTTTSRWRNSPAATLTNTNYQFDDSGNVLVRKDPLGNATTYSFFDEWTNTTCAPPGSVAYATKVTNAKSQSTSVTYNSCTGTLASVTDPNGQTTTLKYDAMDRRVEAILPDTGSTCLQYSDLSNSYCPPSSAPRLPITIVSTQPITSGGSSKTTTTILDGLSRTVQTQLNSDPDGVNSVNTSYDGNGNVATVTNPFRSTSDPTYGVTTYNYDALGRVTLMIPSDGSATADNVKTTYDVSATGGVSVCTGTTVVDEAGISRTTCDDALGRLTSVWEAPSGFNYLTNYTHDTLGNLLSVNQSGSRARTFTYDSVSELLTAANPESGTITYSYDADGNVSARKDARSIVTTYSYDALNRVTQKVYSDGTPTATYLYDTASTNGVTLANPIGRLSRSATPVVESLNSYDPVGRVVEDMQTTPEHNSIAFLLTYTYNLLGVATSFTNALGSTFTYTIDSAGRTTQITSSVSNPPQYPPTLVTVDPGAGFFPNGSLRKMTLGNGLTESHAYDKRWQPCRISINSSATNLANCTAAVPSGNVLDLTGGFNLSSADNGDLYSWVAAGQQTFNRTYIYDSINRVHTMADSATSQTCKGLSWTYDNWGNRTAQSVTSGSCPAPQTAVNTNNQITSTGYSYDASGNLLSDGTHTYKYDAENRITAVDNGATATYSYDADGRRVEKVISSGYTDYIYDYAGNVAGEWNGAASAQYIYLGGALVAEYTASTTQFIHRDHLGSTRLVTSVSASVLDSLDYLPFGERQTGGTTSTHKFTGKERDSESNLDNFLERYYTSQVGRFMSPDLANVAGDLDDSGNPQSWNAYAYVRNNPLSAVDPNGEDCIYINSDNPENSYVQRGDCTSDTDNGIFVNGTVTSFTYDPSTSSYGYSFNSYPGDPAATGGGTISPSPSDPATDLANAVNALNPGGFIAGSALLMAENATAEFGGRMIGAGIESLLAARAAKAAEAANAAVDVENLSNKIVRQMLSRGWTKQEILDTIQSGKAYDVINKATGGPATEYVNPATGKFVVVDNTTKQVLQVSGPGFLPNHLVQ